jgi:hypothetical protein
MPARPEITGRRRPTTPAEIDCQSGPPTNPNADAQEPSAVSARSSDTVPEFCESERISLAMYYKMRSEGWGPDEAWIGTRVIITPEAKLRWRRQREAAAKLGIRRGLPASTERTTAINTEPTS